MKISVRNFKRVERADIDAGPIVLIGGKNDNGKSSILQATALAVTGRALPAGLAKKDAAKIMRRGASSGSVTAFIGEGAVKVAYPQGEATFDGVITISTIAAGLHEIGKLKPDDLSKVLGRFIGAEPTLDDLLTACTDAGLGSALAGKVWSKIQDKGWDDAYTQAQEQGIKLKGAWESRTGQKRWGAKIGASWLPPTWAPELEGITIEESDVIELRRRLQTARENATVDGAVIDRLAAEVQASAGSAEALGQAQAALREAEAAVVKAKADLAALPRPEQTGGDMPCPHCGGFVHMKQIGPGVSELVKANTEPPNQKETDDRRAAIAKASGDLARLETELGTAKAKAIDAQVALTRTRSALAELEAAQAKSGGEDVADLTAELAELERKFIAIEQRREAGKTHAGIMLNVALQDILSPDGLRQTVMNRELERFNETKLASLCQAGGWRPVRINADMSISWGDMEWWELGESARWIVNRILQVAIALADGSKLVVMDAADICDADNRNKLFGLLMKQPFETLVGMTFNKPELMPNLPAAKAGARYWIANGILEPIA